MLQTHSPSLANTHSLDHDLTIREVKDRLCSILSPQDQTTLSDHAKLIESFLQDLKAEKINTLLLDPEDMTLPILARTDKKLEEAYAHFLASQTDFAVRYKKLLREIQGFPELESILKAELEDMLTRYGRSDPWYKKRNLTIDLKDAPKSYNDFDKKIRGKIKLTLKVSNTIASQLVPEDLGSIFSSIGDIKHLNIISEHGLAGTSNPLASIFQHIHTLKVLTLKRFDWQNIPQFPLVPISPSGSLRHLELRDILLSSLSCNSLKTIFAHTSKVHTLILTWTGLGLMSQEKFLTFFSCFPNLVRVQFLYDYAFPELIELFKRIPNHLLQQAFQNVHILMLGFQFEKLDEKDLNEFYEYFPSLKKVVWSNPSLKKKTLDVLTR